MKKIILLLLLVNNITMFSQEILWLGIGGGHTGFDTPDDSQFVKIDTNHIWFITKAEKSILFTNNSLNTNSLITDTSAYYESNKIASFNFKLILDEGDYYWIQFYHKYDFEYNKDGGIVETSYDNGKTWQNIIYDTIIQNNVLEIINFYGVSDTISSYGNQPGFTGMQSEYLSSHIQFFANPERYLDTMLLRFTISTDPVDAQNEGWMLDDFYFEGGYFESIKNNNSNFEILLYPNPVQGILAINSDMLVNGIQIFNILGRKVFKESKTNISSIDVRSYSKGIYIIKLKTQDRKIITSKF